MIVVVVKSVGRRQGRFSASVNGELLVKSSSTPFLAAARKLFDAGADPNEKLVMRHHGKDIDCLLSTVGAAANLIVMNGRFYDRRGKLCGDQGNEDQEEEPITLAK